MATNRRAHESKFSDQIKGVLDAALSSKKYRVHIGKSVFYKLEIDASGKLRPSNLNPVRGQYAFQTDILVEKLSPMIPLVVIEVKFGGFSTHDIITYSSKAVRHKEIYPYLQYGFVVGGIEKLSRKFLTHNQGIDFAIALPDIGAHRDTFLKLVRRQVRIAEELVKLLEVAHPKFSAYERRISIAN